MDLSDITIGIKTILRDTQLYSALFGLRMNLRECPLIIADDGLIDNRKSIVYDVMRMYGDRTVVMDFDSGFGAKSNAIADLLETEFLLVGSDDFEFNDLDVRIAVQSLLTYLNQESQIDMVSGRVNHRPYEANLEIDRDVVSEIKPEFQQDLAPFRCDLTVNFSLIRRRIFEKVRWDNDAKIGQGEHAAFFLDVKNAGFKVACHPRVNINEQVNKIWSRDYTALRNRARSRDRSCFDKRGIKKYVMADGQVDYDVTNRD